MAPAVLGPEHEFVGVAGNAGTANAAFLASLTDEGCLLIRDAHVLSALLPSLPLHSSGLHQFDYRRVWFCLMPAVRVFDGSSPILPRPIWLGVL